MIEADPTVAGRLDIPVGEPIIELIRLRLADNRPVSYETRYLAESLCPELLENDLENSSVHSLLVKQYHIPLVKMVHTVEVGRLNLEQAKVLQAEPNSNAFFVDVPIDD